MIFKILYDKYNKLALNKEELSAELGISQSTLNRMIRDDNLPITYTRLGNKYLFTIKSLAEYYEAIDLLAS